MIILYRTSPGANNLYNIVCACCTGVAQKYVYNVIIVSSHKIRDACNTCGTHRTYRSHTYRWRTEVSYDDDDDDDNTNDNNNNIWENRPAVV